MDGWAGELCYDLLNFQPTPETLTMVGYWYGPGYPAGNIDHHGRGPGQVIEIMGLESTLDFLDAATQTGSLTASRVFYLGDDGGPDTYVTAPGTPDAISGLGLVARRSPIREEEGWDEALCAMPGFERGIYQTCRLVSVPEPGAWLMMATGMLGLGYVAWRRKEEDVAA